MQIIKDPDYLERMMRQYDIPSHFKYYYDYQPYFHLVRFDKGELIYRTKAEQKYLLFFLSGKIKVCANLSNGKSMLVCFYNTFHVLGDLELYEIDTSPTTLQAIDPCLCIALDLKSIRPKLMNDTTFLRYVSESLAHKLVQAANNNSINMLYPLENKLASYISLVQENHIFNENLTLLADLLGTSYRHLLRVLRHFVDTGLLKKVVAGYEILDIDLLEELASDLYVT